MNRISLLVCAAVLLLAACEPKPGQPPTPKTEAPTGGDAASSAPR